MLLFFHQRLWPAIDFMLKEVMLYAYTVEVREAWRAIFDFLVERMEIGMRQAQEKRDKARWQAEGHPEKADA